MWLRHVDPALVRGKDSPLVVAGANWDFWLKNVEEGQYRFEMSSVPWGFYIKAVTWRGANVIERGLTVGPGGIDGLDVVLSPDGGQVEGFVKDDEGKPAGDVKVLLIPVGKRRDSHLYHEGGTGQDGRFRFSGIAPGAYSLSAWLHIEWGDWHDPVLLERYQDRTKRVSIEAKKQLSLDLPLIHIKP